MSIKLSKAEWDSLLKVIEAEHPLVIDQNEMLDRALNAQDPEAPDVPFFSPGDFDQQPQVEVATP